VGHLACVNAPPVELQYFNDPEISERNALQTFAPP
jgi:hypothetical protein